ncbi:MAG: LysR family transcriptional regulator [Gluconacetobacter diazotrophicus]|nr:LysR family transcriptional regulator [Gluconacetobacter diazotrophicus]
MDRLDAMALFVAALEAGSLAGAARRLGRSPTAATRAVAMLEQQAGERLLARSTRRLRATPAGERRAEAWREVLHRLNEVEDAGAGRALGGTVTVTAPELFGRMLVMEVVEGFLRLHPGVSARVLLLNRVVDLVGEGVDVAVRLAALPDSGLAAVRVGAVRPVWCAAPDYLRRTGIPDTPAALAEHTCLGLGEDGPEQLWRFIENGRRRSVRVRTRLACNGAGAVLDAALRGMGIAPLLSYQVAEHLAAGRLARVLEPFASEAVPVQLVFAGRERSGAATRAFVDHAAPLLRAALRGMADPETGGRDGRISSGT